MKFLTQTVKGMRNLWFLHKVRFFVVKRFYKSFFTYQTAYGKDVSLKLLHLVIKLIIYTFFFFRLNALYLNFIQIHLRITHDNLNKFTTKVTSRHRL